MDLNVLEEIIKIKKTLEKEEEKGDKNSSLDKAINELNNIIEENKEEQEHKNIGTKTNKFNIDKYISAENKINDIINSIEIKGIYKIVIENNIKNVQEEIKHRISMYNKGKN